ncbi:MAG: hypothetical protein LBL13_03360 [Bacteroidales bacterium]|jgi:hypothetical protein|nr:hypothetical protein [Bacteroidales bacterium]
MEEIVDKGGRILIVWGEVGRLAALFNCSGQTVRNALRGGVISELADWIRAEALRSGGVERKKRVRILKEEV